MEDFKLTKFEALTLVKCIEVYQLQACDEYAANLQARLERYVLGTDVVEVVQSCEDEEDEDEEEEVEEAENPPFYGEDLHDLKPVKAKIVSSSFGQPDEVVTLEFENADENTYLIVNGEQSGYLLQFRQDGSVIEVKEVLETGDAVWHKFDIIKMTDEWQISSDGETFDIQ